ncbi:MAG TPA: FecR family protein [Gallionella sp.]|nr:FecR family protein [Gallionella sp.]
MNSLNKVFHSLAAAVLLLGSGAVYANTAGYVQFVNGEVQLTTAAGQTHKIQKGDAVNEGDTLTSAKAASAQIKMQDGGFVAVRQDTQLKFDSFKFSGKEDGSEQSFFSLFKGGFRAVTGLIGRINKPNYHITTPTSTIGIRGTDHETFVVVPGSLLAAVAPTGAYNKVNLGETSMTTDKGTIFVLPNQMGFAGGLDQMPKIQPINTNLFTVAPQPSLGAKMDSGKGGDKGARETAVVDTTAEAAAGGSTSNTGGTTGASVLPNIVPPTVVVTPTILGIVTAPFVNTDIAYDVVGASIGAGIGVGSAANVSPMPSPTNFIFNYGSVSGSGFITDTFTLSGGTPARFSDATTGAQWGYWTNVSSLTATYSYPAITGLASSTSTFQSPGVISWITAPSASPFYLPSVLQGTASYNLIGGVATDGTNVGTIGSATLNINFAQQLVDLLLNATVNGVTWNATGTGASLTGAGQNAGRSEFAFSTSGCEIQCFNGHGSLTVTANNATTTSGYVSGALTGSGLTGAIISYSLLGTTHLTGVAALGLSAATPINTATPYQIGLTSMPIVPASLPYPNSNYPYPVTWDTVNGGANNTATLQLDAAGNPVSWQEGGSILANALFGLAGSQIVTISGATAADRGTDPVSGINWGRWSGGTFTFTPLAGGTPLTQSNAPGGFHWILTPAMSGPISLPVSGTYNYVLAGGTRPTDQLGNLGTLNSASLTANFTAMTVNMAASVTVPGVTFNGSAAGVPIQQGTFFEAGGGGAFGTLTCTGTGCGPATATAGHAIGVFTQAGLGAAVSYGFETGTAIGSPTTVVSGVAAFHR